MGLPITLLWTPVRQELEVFSSVPTAAHAAVNTVICHCSRLHYIAMDKAKTGARGVFLVWPLLLMQL